MCVKIFFKDTICNSLKKRIHKTNYRQKKIIPKNRYEKVKLFDKRQFFLRIIKAK